MRLLGLYLLVIYFVCSSGMMEKPKKVTRIVIDAAHGGKDHGSTFGYLSEKTITENIATKIHAIGKSRGLEIILLRKEDEFFELTERVLKINEIHPDLILSLHINHSDDTTENGVEAIVSKENTFHTQSRHAAEKILKQLHKISLNKKAVKDANLFILKNSNCPSALLNIGYLSNEKDRNYITSEAGQMEIARSICRSLE